MMKHKLWGFIVLIAVGVLGSVHAVMAQGSVMGAGMRTTINTMMPSIGGTITRRPAVRVKHVRIRGVVTTVEENALTVKTRPNVLRDFTVKVPQGTRIFDKLRTPIQLSEIQIGDEVVVIGRRLIGITMVAEEIVDLSLPASADTGTQDKEKTDTTAPAPLPGGFR